MVVLHVAAPDVVGGLERVVQALAAGQRRRGHRVALAAVVVTPGEGEPPLLAELRDAEVEVHVVRAPGRHYLRERAAIGRLCATLHPAVVHTHGYRPDVVDAGVARGRGVPVVTTVHGFTGGDWKNRIYERLQLRAFRRFEAVVAVSRLMAEQLARRRVSPSRIHCVPNAWAGAAPPLSREAARQALGLPTGGYQIGWVGRFSPEKGPDVLVRALAGLADLPVRATMLGDGPERAAVGAEALRLGVADRITWLGLVPGAARLIGAFDLFALSSRTEGTPIVLFEAMAAGVPIVAARVGGVPDVVGEGEAVLVPGGDAVALAAAIRAVIADPTQAAERAAAARRRLATAFAEGPWLDRYEAVYESARGALAPALRQ
jgi:glycosyltransferase involved in cell wall biosynthesis